MPKKNEAPSIAEIEAQIKAQIKEELLAELCDQVCAEVVATIVEQTAVPASPITRAIANIANGVAVSVVSDHVASAHQGDLLKQTDTE